MACSTIG